MICIGKLHMVCMQPEGSGVTPAAAKAPVRVCVLNQGKSNVNHNCSSFNGELHRADASSYQ